MPLLFLSIAFPIMEMRFDAIVLVGMDFPYFLSIDSIFSNTFHIFAVFTECHIIYIRRVTFLWQLDTFMLVLLFQYNCIVINAIHGFINPSCFTIEDSAGRTTVTAHS